MVCSTSLLGVERRRAVHPDTGAAPVAPAAFRESQYDM